MYRRGSRKPADIAGLASGQLEVAAGSSHAERLRELSEKYPALSWAENKQTDSEGLLNLVSQQLIDYTVADSNVIALNQRFYPELRVALDLGEPQPLAWAFPLQADDSLYQAATKFFAKIRKGHTLEQLLERYYGHVAEFDYVGTRLYLRHIQQRLPHFRSTFEQAGKKNRIDWRLLAAMGYQESHWNPKARSHTGVRGIMMLTLDTASQVDIDNRLDPEQSINGGAHYFQNVKRKIPRRIPEPDRTWMALAAYNVGFGHLEDARKLTEMRDGDPDKWVDVKAHAAATEPEKMVQAHPVWLCPRPGTGSLRGEYPKLLRSSGVEPEAGRYLQSDAKGTDRAEHRFACPLNPNGDCGGRPAWGIWSGTHKSDTRK